MDQLDCEAKIVHFFSKLENEISKLNQLLGLYLSETLGKPEEVGNILRGITNEKT